MSDDKAKAPEGAPKREKKSLPRRVGSVVLQIALVAAVVWAVSAWQARDLVPTAEAAPGFDLRAMDGERVNLADARGRKVVLYFFAPWCSVCSHVSRNIVALREATDEEDVAIYAVGLAWERPMDLARYGEEHHLNVPILMGDDQVQAAYRIEAFPTVYVVDEEGLVEDRVVGYTTELGLRWRTL